MGTRNSASPGHRCRSPAKPSWLGEQVGLPVVSGVVDRLGEMSQLLESGRRLRGLAPDPDDLPVEPLHGVLVALCASALQHCRVDLDVGIASVPGPDHSNSRRTERPPQVTEIRRRGDERETSGRERRGRKICLWLRNGAGDEFAETACNVRRACTVEHRRSVLLAE
jgi:hypothetical protein